MDKHLRHWRSAFSFLLAFQFTIFAPVSAVATAVAKVSLDRATSYHQGFGRRLATVKVLDVRDIARAHIVDRYKWGGTQFKCLDQLWTQESHWNYKAFNKESGAGGIPQALPAKKMSSAGADWRTNPVTQIRWGTRYIFLRYGTPCEALNFESRRGYY